MLLTVLIRYPTFLLGLSAFCSAICRSTVSVSRVTSSWLGTTRTPSSTWTWRTRPPNSDPSRVFGEMPVDMQIHQAAQTPHRGDTGARARRRDRLARLGRGRRRSRGRPARPALRVRSAFERTRVVRPRARAAPPRREDRGRTTGSALPPRSVYMTPSNSLAASRIERRLMR